MLEMRKDKLGRSHYACPLPGVNRNIALAMYDYCNYIEARG